MTNKKQNDTLDFIHGMLSGAISFLLGYYVNWILLPLFLTFACMTYFKN